MLTTSSIFARDLKLKQKINNNVNSQELSLHNNVKSAIFNNTERCVNKLKGPLLNIKIQSQERHLLLDIAEITTTKSNTQSKKCFNGSMSSKETK